MCQAVSAGPFPAAVRSRAQDGPRLRAFAVYLVEQRLVPSGRVRDLLADRFDARLSRGTLVTWVQQGAATLAPTDAIGILPSYTGDSVHDGWKPYQANTTCRHALCNIHPSRANLPSSTSSISKRGRPISNTSSSR